MRKTAPMNWISKLLICFTCLLCTTAFADDVELEDLCSDTCTSLNSDGDFFSEGTTEGVPVGNTEDVKFTFEKKPKLKM